MGGERGLTLLEVVVALMLFAMMAVLLLSGQGSAADSLLRARTERDIAYLLPLRLNLAALNPDEYEDGDEGDFPSDKQSRLLDEAKIFGTDYEGYRWRIEKVETIGAGADAASKVAGGDPLNLLFAEEGGGTTSGESGADEEIEEVEEGTLDRMYFLRVTVFPPGYDEGLSEEEKEAALPPRSAWTAVAIPESEEEKSK